MTAGLAITSVAVEQAQALLAEPNESAGIARGVRSGGASLLLGPIAWVDEAAYQRREPLRLEVRSFGWAPAMIAIARDGDVPVFVHTHPTGEAFFSNADDAVDRTIATEIERITGAIEVASVVLGGTPDHPNIAMRRIVNGILGDPEIVRVAGPRLQLHLPPGKASGNAGFDRQDRAYGPEGRRVLNALTLGIVGAGGTGTPTHEQALRIGIGLVISVDDDIVTDSTPTRGYGMGSNDIGDLKVNAMARLNDHIGLGSNLTPLPLNVRDPAAEDALAACDVIIGCTDGHYSRVVLNRLAYHHLIPVIDLGVLISTDDHGRIRVDERVTVIGPGAACLICHGRISFVHARAENMAPEERRAQAREGYVPDVDEPAPAVITYTTMTSAFGMTTLLHRLFGIGDNRHTELIIQPNDSRVRTIVGRSREGCFCDDPTRWGQGFTTPRLGLVG